MVHFTSFWFGFVVVWLLRFSGTSGNFRIELQERWRRTAVFFTSMFWAPHFVCFCHFTAMDAWTSNWLHDLILETSHRMPIFLGKCDELQLRFFWWNTGRLNWQTSLFSAWKLRDDLTLLEILGEISLLLLRAWGNTSKADLLAGKRTRCWGEKTSAKALGLLAKVARGYNLSFEVGNFEGAYTWAAVQCWTTSRVLLEVVWGRGRTSSQKVSTLSSEPGTSTSRVGSQATSLKVVDFRMAGNNQRMNFVNKPFDNCLLLYQLSFEEFFYSFWSGNSLHRLLDPELPMGRKIEMMFPLLLASEENYPEALRWSAWGPIYTPEEQYLLQNIIEIRVRRLQQHLNAIPRSLQQDFLTKSYLYFCVSMCYVNFNEGHFYPMEFVEERHFSHSVFMINFCMSPRSAINFALFGVNLVIEELEENFNQNFNQAKGKGKGKKGKGLPIPLELQYPMLLVAVRLTSQNIYDRIGAGTANFWNRIYYDYFLNVKIRYDFSLEEQASMRYFVLQHHALGRLSMAQWSDFYFKHLKGQGALHPVTGQHRFFHLITSHQLHIQGTPDFKVPSHFVLNFARARMWTSLVSVSLQFLQDFFSLQLWVNFIWAQISSTILLRICKILLYQMDFTCPWLCNFFWWLVQDL